MCMTLKLKKKNWTKHKDLFQTAIQGTTGASYKTVKLNDPKTALNTHTPLFKYDFGVEGFYGGRWLLTRARACCRWGLVCVGTVRLLPAVSCVALFTRTFARVSAATLRVDLGVRQVHHIRHLRHTNTCHYRVTSQTLTRTHTRQHIITTNVDKQTELQRDTTQT